MTYDICMYVGKNYRKALYLMRKAMVLLIPKAGSWRRLGTAASRSVGGAQP